MLLQSRAHRRYRLAGLGSGLGPGRGACLGLAQHDLLLLGSDGGGGGAARGWASSGGFGLNAADVVGALSGGSGGGSPPPTPVERRFLAALTSLHAPALWSTSAPREAAR